jgi:hypothetical protein
MLKPSKCEAWYNVQQSPTIVIREMKSWAMKSSNVVVCSGACVQCWSKVGSGVCTMMR